KTEERGAFKAGYLVTPGDTKVYEMKAGIDEDMAAMTNLDSGPGFHLSLNNVTYFDNRIPPMGATRAELASVRASNVPADTYEDNQSWDDTRYLLPVGATRAIVTLYYQTTTGEYIDFLEANSRDGTGATAKRLWLENDGMVPAIMDQQVLDLSKVGASTDLNHDGLVNGQDLTLFLVQWGDAGGSADFNLDGIVDGQDLTYLLSDWTYGE
ncbi:MAG: GC-type dockerin domain-anchored protein, partial [Planctomycetota bacterium]|nr:GC-type dockerin domain-anchored protein [Planctomycetota bacterium]